MTTVMAWPGEVVDAVESIVREAEAEGEEGGREI